MSNVITDTPSKLVAELVAQVNNLIASTANDRAATTLGAAITTTGQTAVTLSAALPVSCVVLTCESEDITITAGAGTTSITVTRGSNGTTAATHLISTPIAAKQAQTAITLNK